MSLLHGSRYLTLVLVNRMCPSSNHLIGHVMVGNVVFNFILVWMLVLYVRNHGMVSVVGARTLDDSVPTLNVEGAVLCRSIKDNILHNISHDPDLNIGLELKHTFLDVEKGLVPDVNYTANFDLPKSNNPGSFWFFATSQARGFFSDIPRDVQVCNRNSDIIIGPLNSEERNLTLAFTLISANNTENSIDVWSGVIESGKKSWAASVHHFPVRSGCFQVVKLTEGTVTSKDYITDIDLCQRKYLLFKSPVSRRLELQFQEVIVPQTYEGSWIWVHNISEAAPGMPIGVTSGHLNIKKQAVISAESGYLLMNVTRCLECRFSAKLVPLTLPVGCNFYHEISSDRFILLSSSSLATHSLSLKECRSIVQAPAHHKILVFIDSASSPQEKHIENCHHQKVVFGPIAHSSVDHIVWCGNTSSSHSTFISSGNSISFEYHWDNEFLTMSGKPIIGYKIVPPCTNRTFMDDSRGGSFCSEGHPDVFMGGQCFYSVYVPLGFIIEIKFTLMELSTDRPTSALCDENYLVMYSKDDVISKFCGNWTSEDGSLDFLTNTNYLTLKLNIKEDFNPSVKGFCALYQAVPLLDNLTDDCDYGWVSGEKFCYRINGHPQTWTQAEKTCREDGGHLASITDSKIANLIDDIIKNSPYFESHNGFWIGANDLTYENYYEWADGQTFSYENWFPGWPTHGSSRRYGAQPSDDSWSHQNCVELRNLFRCPKKGEGRTDRFYWSDRACDISNPFICQRLKPGAVIEQVEVPMCNRTITLTYDHRHDILTSPGFPNNYPNSVECHYDVVGPEGQRIVVQFTDFILEDSQSCEYDYLHLKEPTQDGHRRCGDWEAKIKLLHYVTQRNSFHITFSSDFAHTYKGFRLNLSLASVMVPYNQRHLPASRCIYAPLGESSFDSERRTFIILAVDLNKNILCANERFQLKGRDCYLMVSNLETTWTTARQICAESQSQLATVTSADQIPILHEMVRGTYGYMSGVIFWVGASRNPGNSTWTWLDGRTINERKMHILMADDFHSRTSASCLAIQWRQLRSTSALYWTSKSCNHSGRFICKKPAIAAPQDLNRTVSDLYGNLTSVNYPSHYLNGLHYTVKVQGPPDSRIVIVFKHFDLEWQENCLYDYVLLKSHLDDRGIILCGDNRMDFESEGNVAYFTFHSDFSITASGYLASWEIVDLSSCVNRRLLVTEPSHVTSLRYPDGYISRMNCRTNVTSPHANHLLLTIVDLDVGPGFEYSHCKGDHLEVLLDPQGIRGIKLCGNEDDVIPGTKFVTYSNEAALIFRSFETTTTRHRGYNVSWEAWNEPTLETTLLLKPKKRYGRIFSLNYPHHPPRGVNFTQRLVAPLGHRIHIEKPTINVSSRCTYGVSFQDPYSKSDRLWSSCGGDGFFILDGIWSTLNVIYVHIWNTNGNVPPFELSYSLIKDDHFINTTLALPEFVHACVPNPCRHRGRCVSDRGHSKCHCAGHYTGLFCHLTWCDLNVCGDYGFCNLTMTSYTCDCLAGFTGPRCEQLVTPCVPNPCLSSGQCSVVNGSFSCLCQLWYEGPRCESHVVRIPYKPLSQRMLEEPFWLGLITVFSVLLIILCFYCIKRKFADKIEKFLAEEIERSKYQPSPPATRYSLSSTQPSLTPGSQSPQTCPKSLFNRIRKNSILSTTCSPSPTADREQSRAFSFDDILRRVHSSKKRKSNSNGSSSGNPSGMSREDTARKEEEKSRILASLVTSKEPATRRMSLDEFFRMSERKMQLNARKEVVQSETSDAASEGSTKETSFIFPLSPKVSRHSAPSFADIQCIREQSVEYMSSSDSLSCEPSTSEVQADVSPHPVLQTSETQDSDGIKQNSSSDSSPSNSRPPSATPASPLNSKSPPTPPQISITVDTCERVSLTDDELVQCSQENKSDSDSCKYRPKSPVVKSKSSYLEVPHPIPSIQVCSEECDTPEPPAISVPTLPKQSDRSSLSTPNKMDFLPPRKYSVDLPMPKILITTNMSSCDSDEASPPRTPNPTKSMMYLSPLAVISSSADRTISESNLSTSGYSSISSPGLSRCNSSSPISDEIDAHHHANCNRKQELQSPKRPHHNMQMTYLTVAPDKSFYFPPPTIACHCQEVLNVPSPALPINAKAIAAIPGVWKPQSIKPNQDKSRLLHKRNSYQTTSTDDSIDDEGIGMDTIDVKIRKGEVKSARDLEMYIASENQESNPDKISATKLRSSPIPRASTPTPALLESSKPDLLACSVNKSVGVGVFKGSPRCAIRKGEKVKKHPDKHRRSPILSPASTPVKDHLTDSSEGRIPRNSSRTSMSGLMVSSSESDEPDAGYVGLRQKSQSRRLKKPHETSSTSVTYKQQQSTPSSSSVDKACDATGRSSPLSESNGDSAPMDSRSPASSSSESLPSTRDSTLSSDKCSNTELVPDEKPRRLVSPLCNRHRLALEHHALSFPPPSPVHHPSSVRKGSNEDIKRSCNTKGTFLAAPTVQCYEGPVKNGSRLKLPPTIRPCSPTPIHVPPPSLNSIDSSVPSDSEDETANEKGNEDNFRPLLRVPEEPHHPSLRRQEAIVEDDPSDDSSSETTVLLRRPVQDGNSSDRDRSSPSPFLQHKDNSSSQSADISEWETCSLFQSDSPRSPGEKRERDSAMDKRSLEQ